mmetsp:Transcript_6225/g.17396  ORF Transcript_6225/g.17396 Transcript_6225/m.17396 type:complete len:202 (-) Transcript_6225:141-746(-)
MCSAPQLLLGVPAGEEPQVCLAGMAVALPSRKFDAEGGSILCAMRVCKPAAHVAGPGMLGLVISRNGILRFDPGAVVGILLLDASVREGTVLARDALANLLADRPPPNVQLRQPMTVPRRGWDALVQSGCALLGLDIVHVRPSILLYESVPPRLRFAGVRRQRPAAHVLLDAASQLHMRRLAGPAITRGCRRAAVGLLGRY